MDGTAAAQALYWQIFTAEIVACTSRQSSPAIREFRLDRTFQRMPDFASAGPTAGQEIDIFPASDRPEEALVADVRAYASLQDGWDGEFAPKPNQRSIEGATNFIRLLGSCALTLEPSLHADGSVMLENEAGAAIRFLDADRISAVLPGYSGIVAFDGLSVPPAIARALDI